MVDGTFRGIVGSPVPTARNDREILLGFAERLAPIAQSAEAADLKSAKSGFESQWGHGSCRR